MPAAPLWHTRCPHMPGRRHQRGAMLLDTGAEMNDRRKSKHGDRDARGSDEARTRERAREDREVDDAALSAPRSEWQEPSEPAAGKRMSAEELKGMDLLGRASVRNGALEGVGQASAESGIDRPPSDQELSRRSAHRKNPPLSEDALGDGGISSSGGVAGGARGGAGTSNRGANTPEGYEKAGPGEQKSTSRFDLDRENLDVPEE